MNENNKIIEMFTGPLTDKNGESYTLKIAVFEDSFKFSGVENMHTMVHIERNKDHKMVYRMVTVKLTTDEVHEQACIIKEQFNKILEKNGIFDSEK